MNPLPHVSYVELYVPDAKSEQEFLRFAVQAAVAKYREMHGSSMSCPQTTYDEVCSQQVT